ncbi:MAG: hypothetical protein HC884_13360 [Chloroflexaceae bacterium]|nr:hypothetical protein [Chloroflexaceae bacterium]
MTDDTQRKSVPVWSPDGTKLLFWAGQEESSTIYVANVDGSGVTEIIQGEDSTWSPDGQKIAFTAIRDNISSLYTLTMGDTHLLRLTHDIETVESAPAWSPDGSLIAFARTIYRNMQYSYGIFIVPVDGSALPVQVAETAHGTPAPVWDPTGTYLVFSNPPGMAVKRPADGVITLVRADGVEQTMVTEGQSPRWCPQ